MDKYNSSHCYDPTAFAAMVNIERAVSKEKAMLKSCKYCQRIHDSKYDCGKKPQPIYKRTKEDNGRYTTAWNNKSVEIKERSLYLCAVCRERKVYVCDGLETHHIIKLRERPELLLVDSNLICLCGKCHELADRGKIDREYLTRLAEKRDCYTPQ